MCNAQCVSLHGKIYVGGGITSSHDPFKVFISTNLKSWSVFNTPTKYYALTTYHSKLMLIGGKEQNRRYATNKVWTTGTEQIKWQLFLPPMATSRYYSSAINTQNQTECAYIIVTGGMKMPGVQLNTVEVFVQEEWSVVQPLPLQCFSIKCTIHGGILYLLGGYKQDNFVFYCKLDSLLSSLQSNDTLWKTSRVPLYNSSCETFHHHLLSVGGSFFSSSSSSDIIHAYSPLSKSWLHVSSTASAVISTGQLVVIGGRTISLGCKVFKASLKGEDC